MDTTKEESIRALVEKCISTFGRIDYCANVAGIIRFGNTEVLSTSDWDLVQDVNLRGVFLCAKYQIKAMLNQDPLSSR